MARHEVPEDSQPHTTKWSQIILLIQKYVHLCDLKPKLVQREDLVIFPNNAIDRTNFLDWPSANFGGGDYILRNGKHYFQFLAFSFD